MTRQFINCNPTANPPRECCRLLLVVVLRRTIMANCTISESISMENYPTVIYPSSDDCFCFFLSAFRQSKDKESSLFFFFFFVPPNARLAHIATVIHHAGPFAKSFELLPSWEMKARAGERLCASLLAHTIFSFLFLYDLLHIEGRSDDVVSARFSPRRYQPKSVAQFAQR